MSQILVLENEIRSDVSPLIQAKGNRLEKTCGYRRLLQTDHFYCNL